MPQASPDRPIIFQPSTRWKLYALVVGLGVAGILMAGAQLFIATLAPKEFALAMIAGVGIGLASFAFACFAIRCPSCGNNWFWSAVSKKRSDSWQLWLLQQKVCPACGKGDPHAT